MKDPAALKAEFNLFYHVDSLLRLDSLVPLRGARVLEIGGALPAGLVNGAFGVATWLGVDDRSAYLASVVPGLEAAEAPAVSQLRPECLGAAWMTFDGRAQDIPFCADGQFDLVVS